MTNHRYSARISVTLVGDVDTGVETHKNSDYAGGSWVMVRTGPVLTYCEHPSHVAQTATAWNHALVKARSILPADSYQAPTSNERVIAQVTLRSEDGWHVGGLTAQAAPDQVAVLFVRIGPVTFRCYDQAAVEAMQETWTQAAMVAHLLWRPKPKTRTTHR